MNNLRSLPLASLNEFYPFQLLCESEFNEQFLDENEQGMDTLISNSPALQEHKIPYFSQQHDQPFVMRERGICGNLYPSKFQLLKGKKR